MLIIAILLSLICLIVLLKGDFNHRRVLNDLSVVDDVARIGAKIFAIGDNWRGNVKSLCLNKTFTKSSAVPA